MFVATFYPAYRPQDGMWIGVSEDGTVFRNLSTRSGPVFSPPQGVRDPAVMHAGGRFWLASTDAWPAADVPPRLHLAASADLLSWEPRETVVLGAAGMNNFVDVPQWLVDEQGTRTILACIDSTHHWVTIDAPGSGGAWGQPLPIVDENGRPLVQGNTFVSRLGEGSWLMLFDPFEGGAQGLVDGRFYSRTSRDLREGWSVPRPLDLDPVMDGGDAESVLVLPGGTIRFYVSSGNTLRNRLWHVESRDAGRTWSRPVPLRFEGFDGLPINWAQVAPVDDPSHLAGAA